LFATAKEEFKARGYWSGDQHESDAGSAWCQDFFNGFQYGYDVGYELRARAVRRLVI
jgi:hypothetical protein